MTRDFKSVSMRLRFRGFNTQHPSYEIEYIDILCFGVFMVYKFSIGKLYEISSSVWRSMFHFLTGTAFDSESTRTAIECGATRAAFELIWEGSQEAFICKSGIPWFSLPDKIYFFRGNILSAQLRRLVQCYCMGSMIVCYIQVTKNSKKFETRKSNKTCNIK